jgi:hypothetical protein
MIGLIQERLPHRRESLYYPIGQVLKPLIQDQKATRFMNKKMDKLPRSVKK